jgi:hypothetical protein
MLASAVGGASQASANGVDFSSRSDQGHVSRGRGIRAAIKILL